MKRHMEVIVLIGIPGSGKSTFCMRRFSATHIRINLDMLGTRKREYSLFDWCIANRQSCVIDDTNLTREIRGRWIESAKAAGVPVSGYSMESDIDACIGRNARRKGRAFVPERAILHMFSKLEHPSMSEGFDSLFHVSIDDHTYQIEESSE